SIIIESIVLIVWLETGLLNQLLSIIAQVSSSPVMQGVCFIFAFMLISSIFSLPESLYSTFVIEEKFGFNKMTPALFLKDMLKQFLLAAIIGLPFLFITLKILYGLGSLWWLYTWAFIIVFQFIMIWAYPKFIAPLFNKFTKMEDEELIQNINSLSDRCDVNFKDYYIMNASIRSSHGNAYFTGFGKNKRIVFFDTLLKSLEQNEVVSVLAHELGHLKRKHILKSIILSSLFMLAGLFVLGQLYIMPSFFQAFNFQSNEPYLAMLLFMLISPFYTFLLTPFFSWLSRRNEFEADEFAATFASAKALITALLKMYKDNSSTLTPHPVYSKFYFSHPPAKERIEFLNSFPS
ncbi:MAG: M48 family metallopeptidase, partial [Halobacteriovoraceae bacterium]|nr:M48 family metallopeptidase [Halobacteriovoraceae bacterium]